MLPKPTNKSINMNPENKLPIQRKNNEKPILLGASCIF
jgi:hypothetical protein